MSQTLVPFLPMADKTYDRVSNVLEMVQNSFLKIKDYKSCLLWVIIDFQLFHLYRDILWAFFIFNSFWLDTDKNHHPMMLWPQDTASILSIFIKLIAYRFDACRTNEARNGETDPSTLLSLVGSFPCMPQFPAFTHSSLEGLGPSFHTTWIPIDVYTEVKDSLLLNANNISPNI